MDARLARVHRERWRARRRTKRRQRCGKVAVARRTPVDATCAWFELLEPRMLLSVDLGVTSLLSGVDVN